MAYRQKEYNYNDKLTKDQNLLMDKLYKMRMSGMAEAFENQLMNPNSVIIMVRRVLPQLSVFAAFRISQFCL